MNKRGSANKIRWSLFPAGKKGSAKLSQFCWSFFYMQKKGQEDLIHENLIYFILVIAAFVVIAFILVKMLK